MGDSADAARVRHCRRTSAVAAWVGLALAACVLLGWALGIPAARVMVPGWRETNPITALMLLILSIALLVRLSPQTESRRRIAAGAATAAAAVGLFRLLGYCHPLLDLGLDHLLTGRFSPYNAITLPAAASMVLLGVALAVANSRSKFLRRAQHAFALCSALIAAQALLSYMYGIPTAYASQSFRPMPAGAAIGFLILSAGVALAFTDRGLAALLCDSGSGGVMARRLIPSCILLPTALGLIRVFVDRSGMLASGTASALIILILTAFLVALISRASVLLIAHDQERREITDQLRAAKKAAEAANETKTAFVANVSHELRTPLTAIVGFADLYFQQPAQNDRDQSVHTIRRNGDHLLMIINDLLDLSKIEAGRMQIETLNCSPAQIAATVVSMLRHKAQAKGLTLELSFDGRVPESIRTDPTRFRQILINLVSNAIKFTESGGVKVVLGMLGSSIDVDPLLRVQVIDTGIGIAETDQEKLFQPFVQSDVSMSRRFGGTGLGLSVARNCAQLLGGNVTVQSEAGRGSTFTCTLHTGSLIGVAMLTNTPSIDPEPLSAASAAPEPVKLTTTATVLVAEDGADNQRLLSHWLKAAGARFKIVSDGRQAVAEALAARNSKQPYDIILMDLQMPVLDGLAATTELRNASYAGPIIALTANALDSDRNRCLQAGCNDFLTKPIDREKLIQAIARYAPKPRSAAA